MKKIISLSLTFIIVFTMFSLSMSTIAFAESGSCGPSAIWTYNSYEKIFTISGQGKVSNSLYFPIKMKPETIIIDEGITEICDSVFSDLSEVMTLILPDSLTTIGKEAFSNCLSLSKITGGNNIKQVGKRAFYGTSFIKDENNYSEGLLYLGGALIKSHLTEEENCTIKDGTKCIASEAFTLNPGYQIFSAESKYNKNIKNVNLPNTIVNICEAAFYGCATLEYINLPDNLVQIEDSAFQNCIHLQNVILPKSLQKIGLYAFKNCLELTEITIPEKIETIGVYAFSSNTSIERVVYNAQNAEVYYFDGSFLSYPVFDGCSSLKNIEIGQSVEAIPNGLFANCTSLVYANLGNVKTIGKNSFYGCTSLKKIVIPKTVEAIKSEAFGACTSLDTVIMPDKNIEVSASAFTGTKYHYISIKGYKESLTIDYGTVLALTCSYTNKPSSASVYWYINGQQLPETKDSLTYRAVYIATANIQVKIIDSDGNVICESKEEAVKVNTSLLRIILFYIRTWLGRAIIVNQE